MLITEKQQGKDKKVVAKNAEVLNKLLKIHLQPVGTWLCMLEEKTVTFPKISMWESLKTKFVN